MIDINKGKGQSLYRRGADDGFWFGLYLCAMFILSVNGIAAQIGSMLMFFGVPFIIYFYLDRSYRADNLKTSFSGLWLHGICIFFFASLIMALAIYIYSRFINPMYINACAEMARQFYSAQPSADAQDYALTIKKVQEAHLLPAPSQLAVTWIMLTVFFGSLLSMAESAIIRSVPRRKTPPSPRQFQQ